MLKIYLGNNKMIKDNNYCPYNDTWFDKYYQDIEFNSSINKVIELIDGVKYIGNYRFSSKYERDTAVSVKELSTGCKTAINVASFNKIFSVAECGDNALQVIFTFKRGSIHLPFFVLPRQFQNDIEVYTPDGEKCIINNNNQLETILNKCFV